MLLLRRCNGARTNMSLRQRGWGQLPVLDLHYTWKKPSSLGVTASVMSQKSRQWTCEGDCLPPQFSGLIHGGEGTAEMQRDEISARERWRSNHRVFFFFSFISFFFSLNIITHGISIFLKSYLIVPVDLYAWWRSCRYYQQPALRRKPTGSSSYRDVDRAGYRTENNWVTLSFIW